MAHPSLPIMKVYESVPPPPLPIVVETTNILATKSAEVHHILYLKSCLRLVFTIYGCYIEFQFTLVSALTDFCEID